MLPDEIVHQANQIASFFAPYPEADAIEGVRDHLIKFWDPAMRRDLLALRDARASDLHPLVRRAIEGLTVKPA